MPRFHHHLKNAFVPHEGNDYRPHALRRNALHTYTALIATVKIAAVFFVTIYAGEAQLANVTPTGIISLTNQARQQYKAGTLKQNTLLTKAATAKANDMAQQHYFAHISPAGVTPWTWFKRAGYKYSLAGENLAIDFVQSEDVIQAWLQSTSHRRNLLNTKYRDIGVAVASAKINGVDSLVVVQMFGTPVATKTVKPVTKVVATKPPPTVTTTPPKTVLGETAPPVEPPTITSLPAPTITLPAPGAVVSNQLVVAGISHPGATLELLVNGQVVATTKAGPDGKYEIRPSAALPEGKASLQTSATMLGQSGSASQVLELTIDATPPAVDPHQSYAIPSYVVDNAYDVAVVVNGQPTSVVATIGGQSFPLSLNQGRYTATVKPKDGTFNGGVLTVVSTDQAGNSSRVVLTDPELFTTGVVASKGGPIVTAVKLIFFSRTFLMTFIVLMFVMATMNIVIQWRHQHHPTIIGSLLVLYLAGTLLVM